MPTESAYISLRLSLMVMVMMSINECMDKRNCQMVREVQKNKCLNSPDRQEKLHIQSTIYFTQATVPR